MYLALQSAKVTKGNPGSSYARPDDQPCVNARTECKCGREGEKEIDMRKIIKYSSRDTETPLVLNTWAISLDQLGSLITT